MHITPRQNNHKNRQEAEVPPGRDSTDRRCLTSAQAPSERLHSSLQLPKLKATNRVSPKGLHGARFADARPSQLQRGDHHPAMGFARTEWATFRGVLPLPRLLPRQLRRNGAVPI